MMSNLQLTLSILKPTVLKNPFVLNAIHALILENNFKVVQNTTLTLTKTLAAKFYEEHQGKFFYNRLQTFMCSGPIEVFILAGDNVISRWRDLLGPTRVYKATYSHPNSIRGLYGLSDTRNVCHGSDSIESAKREIQIFFNDFDVDRWLNDHKK